MRSMTGYGRGEHATNGTKIIVELNSVNRKQADITMSLPREWNELEPRLRDLINKRISRGRLTFTTACHSSCAASANLVLDAALASAYYRAMLKLQNELKADGKIDINTVIRAPGVLNQHEQQISADDAWPSLEKAVNSALDALIKMREREGKHLAKDLIQRLKLIRQSLRKIKQLHPAVLKKYRATLHERIQRADVEILANDERLLKEIAFFAEKSDFTEELTRLDSHLAQFAHHLRKNEPVGRTLDFMTQEIYREFNTLGSKANDVEISQLVVTCKAEMEKVREQIQNIE